jgi:predicted acetylornithine/succinylornithine family transaminase
MMKSSQIPNAEIQYLVHTYDRPDVVFTHGQGVYLYDSDGQRYLDFAAGIAVNALGHSDPVWAEIVSQQAHTLTHVSNLFHTAPHVELAKLLVEASFADRVFYSNSGSEANETAIKFARKWARTNHHGGKTNIVAFEHAFHGRSLGALSLTHKTKYREPFAPLVPGVTFVPYNDLQAAEGAINETICAVFVEPVQGESGIHPAKPGFLRDLHELCLENSALLVFDEIQCGLGRTGRLWAHEAYGVTPDIMTLAKPLAGGLPIGVTLVTEDVAKVIEPGDHGSTFAAGPLICSAAKVVFERINQPTFLESVAQRGARFMDHLRSLPCDKILEVRGAGLMIGVELSMPVKPIIESALKHGLIVINAGENTLRICPPLTISEEELETGLSILSNLLLEDARGKQ